jgi:hypothetical protein
VALGHFPAATTVRLERRASVQKSAGIVAGGGGTASYNPTLLLTMPEPPSLKERHFRLWGETFLFESGYHGFFLETNLLPHYSEILRSWQVVVSAYDIGTPTKKLAPDSIAQQDELDRFFIELKHGDDPPSSVIQQYTSLYQARANDPLFMEAVVKTIKARKEGRIISHEEGLVYPILRGWGYGFLWGLTNPDPATLLEHGYGVEIKSSDPSALIKKTVERLKLIGWSDFPEKYGRSPLIVRLWTEGEHKWCQILLRLAGQNPD